MIMKLMPTLLSFAIVSTVIGQELLLKIEAPAEAIHVSDYPKFTATIENHGKVPVTLVKPGDGSEFNWRTPVIGWSVLPTDETQKQHPEELPLYKGLRCGIMNPIKSEEIFVLKSEESMSLGEWIGSPTFEKSGKHRVVFFYQNNPDLRTGGEQTGVLDKIKSSHPCLLKSNEIIVEVLPKEK